MTKIECQICAFWKKGGERWDYFIKDYVPSRYGDCKRYPSPQPETHKNDWCGEWKLKRR